MSSKPKPSLEFSKAGGQIAQQAKYALSGAYSSDARLLALAALVIGIK